MENTFLPPNYKTPEGNYMKFKPGENTFRVLGHAITGWEYWNQENKPIRCRQEPVGTPPDIKVDDDGKKSVRHFWAFVAYNYESEKIQILEITQKGVMESVKALVQNPKWGDPTGYDITVTRDGTGFDTTYQVMPNPHSVMDVNVSDKYLAMKIDLEALFSGGDPFASERDNA